MTGAICPDPISGRIVRPVRQMAGLLDDLAYGTPTARVPTVTGGRDEINAMGESLNALIDHRANFLDWWKASMAEVTALRDLREAGSETARDEANNELHAAEIAKMRQLDTIRGHLLEHSGRLEEISRRVLADSGTLAEDDAKALAHSAQGISVLLEALATEARPTEGDGAPKTSGQANAA